MDNRLSGTRILRVVNDPSFVMTQLRNQLKGLVSAGADILLACPYSIEVDEFCRSAGIRFFSVPIGRKISPITDLLALVKLSYIILRFRVHICHSVTPKAGLLSAIASFLTRVQVRAHTFTGQPWATNNGLIFNLLKASDSLVAKLNNCLYADSSGQAAFLVESRVVKDGKIRVIGSGSVGGVDLIRFSKFRYADQVELIRKECGIKQEDFVITFLGRVTPEKGISELLSAFDHLRRSFQHLKLLIIGPLEKESGTGIHFADFSLSDPDILLTGQSSEPEKYLAVSSVLVLPSYREGFGSAVIEAAAMGVPAIGSDIYGLRDAIVHGQTGYLVRPGSARAIADCVSMLIKDMTLLSRLSHASRIRCERMFDSTRFNSLLVDEYVNSLAVKGA